MTDPNDDPSRVADPAPKIPDEMTEPDTGDAGDFQYDEAHGGFDTGPGTQGGPAAGPTPQGGPAGPSD
jgi:hypothetical protein